MTLRYRPQALADLDAIATYTRGAWGEEKARDYMRTLRTACETIGRFPRLGPRSVVRHYRRLTVESHTVYYRVTKEAVIIVRVLHERQKPQRHL
jgi:toxin ParE1/3/4